MAGIANETDDTEGLSRINNLNPDLNHKIKPWSFTHMWTTHDVGHFIGDIGYPKFAHCFTNNMINGRELKHLSIFDLQRIGVDNMVDAMKMHIIIKRATQKSIYNFEGQDEPPNHSYSRNLKEADGQSGLKLKLPPAKPFYMEPVKANDLKLLHRNVDTRYNRYNLTLPTIHHQRSICTRRRDDSVGIATLHIDR